MNKVYNKDLLTVKDLAVEYMAEDGIVNAVNGVSFSLKKGETLGLVGETGAGKTTIAKSILQILPQQTSKVTSGSIIFEGKDLLKENERKMRKIRGSKISMIFQDPMTALNPVKRVGEQIAEGIRLHSEMSRPESIEKAKEMLEMVGIKAERFKDYPHQFSGGMKQRVVIAMALACRPELLLADEPTTALDVTIQAQVLEMIDELKTELDTSMILITHDLGIVAQVCDNVAVIYAGEIVELGSREDIFDNPSHPYTKALFDAVPDIDVETDRLSPIQGMPPDPTNLPTGCSFHPRCPYATEICCGAAIEMEEISESHFCRCIHIQGEK